MLLSRIEFYVILAWIETSIYFEISTIQDVLQYVLEGFSHLGVDVHCLQFTMGLCVWMKWSEGSEVSLHSTLSLCGLWAGFPLTAAVLNDYVEQEGDV